MNKTALGFVFGVVIIAAGGVGYFLASNPRITETPPVKIDAAKAAADEAAAAVPAPESKKKTEAPTTPIASAMPAKAEPAKGEAAKPDASKAVSADGMSVAMARSFVTPTYAPGGTVDVAINVEVQGTEPIRALGIQEILPEGFAFDGLVSGAKPDIAPEPGRTGTVDFAWIQVPPPPITLTYRVKAADGTTGTKTFSGQTLARAGGPELRSESIASSIESGAPGSAPAAPAATPEVPAAPAAMPTPEDPAKAIEANRVKLEEAAARLREADAKKAEEMKNAVEVAHSFPAGGYTAGQAVEVSTTLSYAGTTKVSALALVLTLPAGWSFDKMTGGAAPAVAPAAGKTGNVTFIWVDIPALPATLTYTVNVPAGETGARALVGKAAYRTDGGQIEGPPGSAEITNK